MSGSNGHKTMRERMDVMNRNILESMKEADDIRWQCPGCKSISIGRLDAWKEGCKKCGWRHETSS